MVGTGGRGGYLFRGGAFDVWKFGSWESAGPTERSSHRTRATILPAHRRGHVEELCPVELCMALDRTLRPGAYTLVLRPTGIPDFVTQEAERVDTYAAEDRQDVGAELRRGHGLGPGWGRSIAPSRAGSFARSPRRSACRHLPGSADDDHDVPRFLRRAHARPLESGVTDLSGVGDPEEVNRAMENYLVWQSKTRPRKADPRDNF
jgi:hypothetical protein